MPLSRRLAAEFIGTFWLVFAGCGSAVISAAFPAVGIGLLGVSLAFGLTVLTMAYAFGHISGGHFNPAVTVGLWLGRRTPGRDVLPYIVTQVVAGVVAAAVLYVIASGRPGYRLSVDGLAANGYGAHSPGRYTLGAGLLTEVLMTLVFLLVILGATDRRAAKGMGPLAIGLVLTLIHLASIPVTNTSVNPARSTGPALIVGGWALSQLWLFWLAPLVGGALAGIAYRFVVGDDGTEPIAEEAQDTGAADIAIGELGGTRPPAAPR
jgi:aquaporin Z